MPDPAICPQLTIKPNGPVLVPGPLTLLDPTGKVHAIPAGKMIALCRCGGSTMKPYCDGTHGRNGFQAMGEAPPR